MVGCGVGACKCYVGSSCAYVGVGDAVGAGCAAVSGDGWFAVVGGVGDGFAGCDSVSDLVVGVDASAPELCVACAVEVYGVVDGSVS